MGVRQLLPSRGKDTNATLSSFSSSCLFFNDDQEEEGRKRAMSNDRQSSADGQTDARAFDIPRLTAPSCSSVRQDSRGS